MRGLPHHALGYPIGYNIILSLLSMRATLKISQYCSVHTSVTVGPCCWKRAEQNHHPKMVKNSHFIHQFFLDVSESVSVDLVCVQNLIDDLDA